MDFLKDLVREIQEDDLMGGAAELAYRFLFALFPFFIFLAALSGYVTNWLDVQNPTDRIISAIGDTLPSDAAGVLETQLSGILEGNRGGLLSFGALAALWAASSGTKTVMKWMNRVYNVKEDRPFIRKQLVGLGLTLLGTAGFIIGVGVLIIGQVAGSEIAEGLGLSGAWATVVSWARIPAALVLLVAAMAVVYWLTPNAGLTFRWITPGAVTFVLVWIASTVAFGFYVANFGNYQATYGALGGVIILMIWLYITAFVLLLGGKINAVVEARQMQTTEHQTDAAAIEQRDLDPEIARRRRIRPGDGGTQHRGRTPGREAVPVGSTGDSASGASMPQKAATAGFGAIAGAIAVRRLVEAFRGDSAGSSGGGTTTRPSG